MIYGDARSRHASAIVYCCATQRKQIGTLRGKYSRHDTLRLAARPFALGARFGAIAIWGHSGRAQFGGRNLGTLS